MLNAVGIAVLTRYLAVFPFDFSMYAGFNWAVLARIVLIVGIVGSAIGVIVELVKLARALGRRG